MIELHLIGYTEDREFLVLDLDADGPGRYELRIDPDLLATLMAVASRHEVSAPVALAAAGDVVPPAARLTPAEIQGRLRQGRSVKAVAAEAETDPAWIERWLGPVVAEQARILEEARRQPLEGGRARDALGPAVDAALRDRGIDPDEARWKVARRQDGRWKLTLRYADEGRPRSATWLYDRESQSVRAASQHAGSLVGRGRRRG